MRGFGGKKNEQEAIGRLEENQHPGPWYCEDIPRALGPLQYILRYQGTLDKGARGGRRNAMPGRLDSYWPAQRRFSPKVPFSERLASRLSKPCKWHRRNRLVNEKAVVSQDLTIGI